MSNQQKASPSREIIKPISLIVDTMDVVDMSDKEFRIFVVTKLTEMEEKRDKELQEMRKSFNDLKEEMDTLNKNQMELLGLKNVIQEIKTSLESVKSKLNQAED